MKSTLSSLILLLMACLLCSCETKTKRQLRMLYNENEKLTAQVQEQEEQISLLEKQVKNQQRQVASLEKKESERSLGKAGQFDAMKKQAATIIRKLRHDVKVRDEDIRQLEDRLASAKQGSARVQRAAPRKKSSLAGPRKVGGGVHIPGRTCSIDNHGCNLPRP